METLRELRAYLSEQLMKVGKKETTPAHANAASNLAGKLLNTVKMELDYCKQVGLRPNIGFLGLEQSASGLTLEHKSEVDLETGEVKSKKKSLE